jgi:hypothetical protein
MTRYRIIERNDGWFRGQRQILFFFWENVDGCFFADFNTMHAEIASYEEVDRREKLNKHGRKTKKVVYKSK